MKLTRPRAAVLTGLALATLTFSSAPAFAAPAHTVPTGSTLYAAGCNSDVQRLYSVDPATAVLTVVGTDPGTNPNGFYCVVSSAWNPVTKTAYENQVTLGPSTLYSVDLATGVRTEIGGYLLGGAAANLYVSTIAIAPDGHAYAIAQGSSGSNLYSLDPATATLTLIAPLTTGGTSYNGFAVDPTTGLFYLLDTQGHLSTVDVSTGVQQARATLTLDAPGASGQAISFDSAGLMWFSAVNTGTSETSLWSLDPDDIAGTQQRAGAFSSATPLSSTYLATVFVAPTDGVVTAPVTTPTTTTDTTTTAVTTPAAVTAKPALAETGVDEGRTITLLGSAGLALLLGAGLTVAARTRRRSRI